MPRYLSCFLLPEVYLMLCNRLRLLTYGNEIQKNFQNLVTALTQKYGISDNNFDFLRYGSIWNEQKDWMMGLLKKERTLYTSWDNKNLPDSLMSISVNTTALSTSKGWITLSYEFKNLDACFEVLKSQKNSNL